MNVFLLGNLFVYKGPYNYGLKRGTNMLHFCTLQTLNRRRANCIRSTRTGQWNWLKEHKEIDKYLVQQCQELFKSSPCFPEDLEGLIQSVISQ